MPPVVSIGMPVYNGERYLTGALDSLLAQTYSDFELVIADNASTDLTEAICREYAKSDARIRYVRNSANLGVVENFNNVFRLSGGTYFKWAGHDDLCEPEFLASCVQALADDPGVVLACSRIGGIDADGNKIVIRAMPGPGQGIVEGKHLDMTARISPSSPDPVSRWRYMMRNLWWTPHLYGVIRADVLARTPLHPAHYMGDHILLSELALHGRFTEVPQELLYIRIAATKTSRASSARERAIVARPSVAARPTLVPLYAAMAYPARFLEHASSIRRAPLSSSPRMACYAALVATVFRWGTAKAGAAVRKLAKSDPAS